MILRPYQEDFCRRTTNAFKYYKKVLGVLPTGGGKTVCFSKIAEKAHGNVMIIAHREELIKQAADKLKKATGIDASIEMAQHRASLFKKVVVASVQTLAGGRFERFPADHYSLIIVDECHHIMADSYQVPLQYFLGGGAGVLGVTATPNTKGKAGLGNFFEKLAYEISLIELMRQGFLAPISVESFPLHADLTQSAAAIGRNLISGSDFSKEVAAAALEPLLDDLVNRVPDRVGDRKTLIFVPLVTTAQKLHTAFARRGISSAVVHGNSDDRSGILAGHGNRFQFLINSMLLTEGYDDPEISCIIPLRPTKSEILFSQIVGRGTRIFCPWGCTQLCTHAASKKNMLLLDPLWLHEDIRIMRPANLVTKDPEAIEAMCKRQDSALGQLDLDELGKWGLEEAEHERERSLAEKLAAKEKRAASRLSVEQWAKLREKPQVAEHRFNPRGHGQQSRPPSEGQKKIIKAMGINPDTVVNAAQASDLLDVFFAENARKKAEKAAAKAALAQ